jgi:outer membrane protein OmpA-like peptidoglycan-associated protein
VVRAESVREILVAAGVNRSVISVAGRGEREPAVPTADEVAEARNRRVEIKIR